MGILNVDNIQPVGGGTTITLNSSEINVGTGITFESNGQAIYAGVTTFASNINLGGDVIHSGDNTKIRFPANDTITFETSGTEILRITSDGRIGINDSTPNDYEVDIKKRSTATDAVIRLYNNATGSNNDTIMRYSIAGTSASNYIYFGDGDDSNSGQIRYQHSNDSMQFTAAASERLRVDSSGRLLVGRTNNISVGGDSSDHCFEQITSNGYTLTLHANQNNQRGLGIFYASGKTPEAFMFCEVSGSNKFIILNSGNVINANNSYGQISDISLKENIVDAKSQWNDIKNIKIRNFNFKSSTGHDTHTQIGLVAQEVETVCPKLVDTNEDGKKIVTSSVLYMKAVKALQEAQARIETLEAEVAALKAK